MTDRADISNTYIDKKTLKGWNFQRLIAALIITALLQSVSLPCLCDIGTAKITFAYELDALILLRISVAFFGRETGGGWKFYVWLLYTSPLWINGIAYLFFGDI